MEQWREQLVRAERAHFEAHLDRITAALVQRHGGRVPTQRTPDEALTPVKVAA